MLMQCVVEWLWLLLWLQESVLCVVVVGTTDSVKLVLDGVWVASVKLVISLGASGMGGNDLEVDLRAGRRLGLGLGHGVGAELSAAIGLHWGWDKGGRGSGAFA